MKILIFFIAAVAAFLSTQDAYALCTVGVQYGSSQSEFYDINRISSGFVKVVKRQDNNETWNHPHTAWKPSNASNFKVSVDGSHLKFDAPQEDGKEIPATLDVLKLHPTNNEEIMVGAGTLVIGQKVQETNVYVNKSCL